MAATLVPVVSGVVLFAIGLPFGVALALFVVVFGASAAYLIRQSVREARRQGWGSNLSA